MMVGARRPSFGDTHGGITMTRPTERRSLLCRLITEDQASVDPVNEGTKKSMDISSSVILGSRLWRL